MQIGFIGVGNMGSGLAKNLVRAGKNVLVSDLNPAAVEAVLKEGCGGRAVGTAAELSQCDLVFTSLPLPQHLTEVMLGENGVYAQLKPGAVHVELSTIDPATARRLEAEGKARGLGYLQSTLGKTPRHAEKAEEPMFIGGDKTLADALWELFKLIGLPVYVGSIEASCAVKLVSNMIGMTKLAALAEGLRAGERAGLDKGLMVKLFAETGANGYQLNIRGPAIASGDFSPKFGVDLALKDVRLGLEMARAWGLELPATEAALAHYRKASAEGYGREDCCAVYKVVGG